MHMNWRNVKLATAYGIHSAVQRVIVTEKIRNVRRLKAQKQQPRTHGFDEFLLSSDVCVSPLLVCVPSFPIVVEDDLVDCAQEADAQTVHFK